MLFWGKVSIQEFFSPSTFGDTHAFCRVSPFPVGQHSSRGHVFRHFQVAQAYKAKAARHGDGVPGFVGPTLGIRQLFDSLDYNSKNYRLIRGE